ncbi:LysR family transcriptional regulator [Lacisediminihabitans sp. FW035]
MDVPVHALRSFCVLADELHFGAAARRLNISSPSLSQQLSRLEENVGARLFDRNSRRVTLTAAGLELLPLARRVRDTHDDVLDWARARAIGQDGVLRVGVVAAGAGALTTAVIMSAVQQMPTLRLEMRRLGFFDAPTELLAGRVDAVFVPGPLAADPARIRSTTLWTEPRVLVVSSRHRLAGRESIGIAETSEETFVAASGGDAVAVDWWLVDPRPDGSRPRRGPVADDIDGLLELCAAGVGVNIAAASAATHYRRDDLAFVPIVDIEPATIILCTLVRPLTPAAQQFEAIALEEARRAREGQLAAELSPR